MWERERTSRLNSFILFKALSLVSVLKVLKMSCAAGPQEDVTARIKLSRRTFVQNKSLRRQHTTQKKHFLRTIDYNSFLAIRFQHEQKILYYLAKIKQADLIHHLHWTRQITSLTYYKGHHIHLHRPPSTA